MKKDQRYQRIDQLGDDENGAPPSPYRDDPSRVPKVDSGRPTPAHGVANSSDHPLEIGDLQQGGSNPGSVSGDDRNNNDMDNGKRLRTRRGIASSRSPASSRSNSFQRPPFSQNPSAENAVVLEGDLASMLEGANNDSEHANAKWTSPSRPHNGVYRRNSKDGSTQSASGMDHEVDDDSDYNDEKETGSRGGIREDGEGLLCASHGSSFDLLDDEDEINLQRYNRDFSSSLHQNSDFMWDEENGAMDGPAADMYHPRSDTMGSNSKDPWIRMVQNNSQHSLNGMTLTSVKSISDLVLYLQGVRRQARQRRAQRLLTMPSEQWWQRVQFYFMTYCWDTTDVGIVVVLVLFMFWFVGLLWLARINAHNENAASGNGTEKGQQYNGNAEFDDFETNRNSLEVLLQWIWWGLGCVLLIRILGPFAVYNVNNRRRERRRQRFLSGNMQQQQQRMQQQQLPTMLGAYKQNENHSNSSDGVLGTLEITESIASNMNGKAPAYANAASSDSSQGMVVT